jgi:integrase
MTTRQYARLVSGWIASTGLDPKLFGIHSLHRTKATLIYRRTGNLRAVQLLLGHTKIEKHSQIFRYRSGRCAFDCGTCPAWDFAFGPADISQVRAGLLES